MIHLLPDDLVVTEACSDGLLVLDLSTVRCTFLDRTGAQMWQALTSSSDVDEAVEWLHAVFAADRALLRRDLLEFCDHLVAEGLAAREPYQWGLDALAAPLPTELEATPDSRPVQADTEPRHDGVAGLLGAALRDGVAGDVVLLDAPRAAVACIEQAMPREEGDDRSLILATAAGVAEADEPRQAPPEVCLLWVHVTDAEALAQVLPPWLARVSPGGFVVISGLELHVLADICAGVVHPPDITDIVPVEWLTAWWQQRSPAVPTAASRGVP